MTDYEILESGKRALLLLSNATFMDVIREEQELLLVSIGNTQPHESKTRETLYHQHIGFVNILASLNQRADAAKAILAEAEDAVDQTETDSD